MRLSTDTITRAVGDTTQYSAADTITGAVPATLKFGTSDISGRILSAALLDSTAETTKPEADLFLFDTDVAITADNAAFAPTDAEMTHCVAVIPFLAAGFKVGNGNGFTPAVFASLLGYEFTAPNRILYGILVAQNTYTPVSAEVLTIRLGIGD